MRAATLFKPKAVQTEEPTLSLPAIQQRIAEHRQLIRDAQAELEQAQQTFTDEDIQRVITGGSLPSVDRTAIDNAFNRLKSLEEQLPVLQRAESLLLARDRKSQVERESERVVAAHADYAGALHEFTGAIRAVGAAQDKLRRIASTVPDGSFFVPILAQLATAQGVESFVHRIETELLKLGFSDRVADDSPARAAFEHDRAETERYLKTARDKWIANGLAAGVCDANGVLLADKYSKEELEAIAREALEKAKVSGRGTPMSPTGITKVTQQVDEDGNPTGEVTYHIGRINKASERK